MSEWNSFLLNSHRSLFKQAFTHAILLERILLEVAPGGAVLEAGCGLGYLSNLLADSGYKVTAGDIDEEVLLSASEKLLIKFNPVCYKKIDLFKLSEYFAKDSFDVIIHSGVMEHFSDDEIVHSFSQQKAVSKALIFKVPNSRNKLTKFHFGNERFMSNKKWVSLLRDGGYRDIKIYGGESMPNWANLLPAIFFAYPKSTRSTKINNILSTLSHWRQYLSRHTIFVCK